MRSLVTSLSPFFSLSLSPSPFLLYIEEKQHSCNNHSLIQIITMNTNTFNFIPEEYIQAASDTQLSSSHSHLLLTLLNEEDQHDYNQLLTTSLSHDIFHILQQVASFLYLPSSTTWTTVILLKKLVLLQYDIDLLTIVGCLTLSAKYQHSQTHHIDYQLLAQHCHIPTVDLIHVCSSSIACLFIHFSHFISF